MTIQVLKIQDRPCPYRTHHQKPSCDASDLLFDSVNVESEGQSEKQVLITTILNDPQLGEFEPFPSDAERREEPRPLQCVFVFT